MLDEVLRNVPGVPHVLPPNNVDELLILLARVIIRDFQELLIVRAKNLSFNLLELLLLDGDELRLLALL